MRIAPFLALAVAFAACCPTPPSSPTPDPSEEPAPAVDLPAEAPEPASASDDAPEKKAADGAPCAAADDCESGICEGEGCEGEGVCATAQRACTDDLQSYCGCDGETFRTSGSCPGRRFAHRGKCENGPPAVPATGSKANGDACAAGAECASGICEGPCDAGQCVPKERACTRDLVTYCGCDGTEFQSSGSCAGRLYQRRGRC